MSDKIKKAVLSTCHAAFAALFVAGGVQALDSGAWLGAVACVLGFVFMVAAVFQDITEK